MSGFFSSDNKFFILMSKIFDMLVLSIVWLLLSISGLMLAGYFIGTGIVEVGSGLFFILLRCVCRDPMNCGFMIKFIYEQYLNLL